MSMCFKICSFLNLRTKYATSVITQTAKKLGSNSSFFQTDEIDKKAIKSTSLWKPHSRAMMDGALHQLKKSFHKILNKQNEVSFYVQKNPLVFH